MVQWVFVLLACTLNGILVICDHASRVDFKPAAAPSNLRVEVSPFKHTKLLQMAISWDTGKEGKRASSFNIHAETLNDSDLYCYTEPYYAFIDNPNFTSWVIPPKAMDEVSHHVSSFSVHPGCLYRVRVEANPHNGRTYAQTDYRVPECVRDICSCRNIKYLPIPMLHIENLTAKIVNITWSVADTQNISVFKLRAGPKLLHGDTAAIYNLSWHAEQSAAQGRQLYHKQYVPHAPGQYAATVQAVDTHHCHGPEQRVAFVVGENENPDDQGISKNKLFWLILLPSGVILLVTYMLVGHIWHKCLTWIECRKHTPCKPKKRVSYKAFRVKSQRVFRRNPSLQERNVLYVEKEIEEAKIRGEVDSFEISYSQLTFLKEIGRGAFGQVFLAKGEAIRGVPGVRMVAVKKLKVKASSEEREEFLEEIAMLKRVGHHPNIVSLLGCCTLHRDVCMVMEHVSCGDLLNYLRGLRSHLEERKSSVASSGTMYSSLSTVMTSLNSSTYITNQNHRDCIQTKPQVIDHRELHNFALQIARGMAHLELKRITHRDLAARNILIDNNKILKISDFGLSRKGVYVNTRRRKVPLRWLSLEAIKDSLYSSKSDVWAFAIVLWEIGTLGGFPYPTVSDLDLLRFLEQGNRLEKPDIVSQNLYSVMLACWSAFPDDRPSFADLVSYLQPASDRHVYVEITPHHHLPPTSPG